MSQSADEFERQPIQWPPPQHAPIEILEHMFEAFVAISRDWRYTYVNAAAERIVGRSREDLLGRNVWEVFPQGETTFRKACVRAMNDRETVDFEEHLHALDLWLEETVHPTQNGIVVYARDITRRKRAEAVLRERERFINRLAEICPVVLSVVNLDTGRVNYISQEVAVLHGRRREELTLNRSFLAMIHPEDAPRVEESLARWRTNPNDEILRIDYRVRHRNGEWRWFASRSAPFARGDDGRVLEIASATVDITEQRQADEQAAQSHDQLRALSARLERIREEERSRVAREMHDELGQALTRIKFDAAAWLHESSPNQAAMKRGQSILKLADETIRSVRRLATELRPSILDDAGLVAAVEWATEDFRARTGISCRVIIGDVDEETDAERSTAIFRILQETLTNIVRHAGATEVQVRIGREKECLALEVRDNGRGFDEQTLAPGWSLGLLGMRERATLLGGSLAIESAPGQGTRVKIEIPAPERGAAR